MSDEVYFIEPLSPRHNLTQVGVTHVGRSDN